MHIQRHSQLLRHRRERTTPRARRTPSAPPPLSRDREKGNGIETERWLRIYGRMNKREKEKEREREREKDTLKEKAREKERDIDGERKRVCRGAHDFLHILRWLLSTVEDNQAATTSTNDSG